MLSLILTVMLSGYLAFKFSPRFRWPAFLGMNLLFFLPLIYIVYACEAYFSTLSMQNIWADLTHIFFGTVVKPFKLIFFGDVSEMYISLFGLVVLTSLLCVFGSQLTPHEGRAREMVMKK